MLHLLQLDRNNPDASEDCLRCINKGDTVVIASDLMENDISKAIKVFQDKNINCKLVSDNKITQHNIESIDYRDLVNLISQNKTTMSWF